METPIRRSEKKAEPILQTVIDGGKVIRGTRSEIAQALAEWRENHD